VVDEAGRPVPEARVDVFGANVLDTQVEEDGRFELLGLATGELFLEAWTRDGERRTSGVQTFALAEGRAVEGVRLVLKKQLLRSGILVGPDGRGVAGARVVATLDGAAAELSTHIPQTVSDVAGQFTFQLPADTERFHLTAMAPGFALTQIAADARGKEPLIVPVRQVGGTLTVVYAGPSPGSGLPPRARTALIHESYLWGSFLETWAAVQGMSQEDSTRFVIPMLEPGAYTVCRDFSWASYRQGHVPARPGCASGEVIPGGELVLRVE
jgi:hypothetical protein